MASARTSETDDGAEPTDSGAAVQRLVNVLALMLLRGVDGQTDQVELLSRAGFEVKDIASLLGTTRNTVSVTLVKLKKSKGKGRGKRNGKKN